MPLRKLQFNTPIGQTHSKYNAAALAERILKEAYTLQCEHVCRMENEYGYRFGDHGWRYSEAEFENKHEFKRVIEDRADVPLNSQLYLQFDPHGRPKEWAKATWTTGTPHVTIDVPEQPGKQILYLFL